LRDFNNHARSTPLRVFRLQSSDQAPSPGNARMDAVGESAPETAIATGATAVFPAKKGPEGLGEDGKGLAAEGKGLCRVKGRESPGESASPIPFPSARFIGYQRFRLTSSSSMLSLTVMTRALAW
jgi:hypothetical protein